MSQEVRDEFSALFRDRWAQGITTISLSPATLMLLLTNISGQPYILIVSTYVLLITFLVSNSIYILVAKKKAQILEAANSLTVEKLILKYPALQPYGWLGLFVSVVLVMLFSFVPPFKVPTTTFIYGTATPIPTLTFTTTPSTTPSLTPTERSVADYLYYAIVYDSSINMSESFHDQQKWSVARNMLVEIINGLNPKAHYGMIAVGDPKSSTTSDPCTNPAVPSVPFSSREINYSYLQGLQPSGGGSFFQAFVKAKEQLESLPMDTIRTLIYITGSSDTCNTQDEWIAIQNLLSVPDSTLGIYSQIIILDENGIRAQTLADTFNSLGQANVNAQAPQSIEETQGGGAVIVNIVNNVQNFVTNQFNIVVPPTVTQTSTITPTLRPGETAVIPSDIPTRTPTFTATFTKTLTASPIPPTATSSCPPLSHPILAGSGLDGSADIYSPSHCSIGHPPEAEIYTSGPYADLPDGAKIWVLVYAPDHLYYPQSPNACGGGPAPNQDGGSWDVNTYLGSIGDLPKWYDILVVVADAQADASLTNWLTNNCPGFQGIGYETISQWNITEKAYITVQTR